MTSSRFGGLKWPRIRSCAVGRKVADSPEARRCLKVYHSWASRWGSMIVSLCLALVVRAADAEVSLAESSGGFVAPQECWTLSIFWGLFNVHAVNGDRKKCYSVPRWLRPCIRLIGCHCWERWFYFGVISVAFSFTFCVVGIESDINRSLGWALLWNAEEHRSFIRKNYSK
jgi:hypothetical protein